MRSRLLAVLAAAGLAALLAGCAEGPYYGGTYSYGYSDYYYPGYDYGPGYYSYYDYGPGYYYGPGFGLSYSYRSGDGYRHWNGSSWSAPQPIDTGNSSGRHTTS